MLEFPEEDLKDKEAMVVELFQKRRISSGYAADLLGLCLADFMDILKRKEIPFSRYTKEELRREVYVDRLGRDEPAYPFCRTTSLTGKLLRCVFVRHVVERVPKPGRGNTK